MAVTIYSFGNLDALTGIFNAIVMVMGGNDYKDAIRIAIMLGFGIAAINAVTQQHRSWQWVVTVIVMYQILFVPKTTAVLQDRTGTAAARSVSNVPYALGFFAQLKSSIGWVLTSTFETGFQTIPAAGIALPSQLSYSKTGLMFGSSLIRTSRGAGFVDPDVRADVVAFFQNCTVPDLMDGTISPAAFFESGDLWTAAGPGNPSRFSTVHTPSVVGVQNMPCPSARTSIANRMPAQLTAMTMKLATQLYPSLGPAAATTELTASLTSAYAKFGIANASSSASDLILQNAMINLFSETGQLMNLSASDPGAVMMSIGLAQGVASTNASFMAQGRIAEQALPIIKNSVEAIIYAMFPVIVLLMLMSEGEALKKIAKSYLYAMLWLELWPVLYAVVNFIGTTYSAANVSGVATLANGTKALTLNTASQIYTTTISDMAVVGWMTLTIPAIAGAVVWGMDKLQSAVNMGGLLSSVGSNAGQAAQGNVGMGNVSMEQQRLDPNRSSANMRTMSDAYGTTVGDMRNGYETYSTNVGSYLITPQIGKQISSNFAAQSAVEQSEGQTKTKQANASINAAYNDAQSLLRDSGKLQQLGDRYGFGRLGNDGLTASQSSSLKTDLAKKLGLRDSSVVNDALSLGISVPELIKKLAPVSMGANGQHLTEEQIGGEIAKARATAQQLATENRVSVLDNFTQSTDFAQLASTNQRAAYNVQSGLDQSKGYMKSASVNFAEAQRYQERAEKAVALSSGWSGSDTKAWGDFLAEMGVRGTADQTDIRKMTGLMDKFLDRGSLTPDGKGGFMFVAGHGEGPNMPTKIMSTTNAPSANGNSPLAAAYESKTPIVPGISKREGAPIREQKAANDGSVAGARQLAGVQSPDGPPLSGDYVKQEVKKRDEEAQGKANAVAPAIQGAEGNLDNELANREKTLSQNHHPWATEGGKVFSGYAHQTAVDGNGKTTNSLGIADPAQQIAEERAQKAISGKLPEKLKSGDRAPTHSTLSPEQRREKLVEMAQQKRNPSVTPLATGYTKTENHVPTAHLTPEQRQAKIQQILRDRSKETSK